MISLRFPRLQQDKRCWIAYQYATASWNRQDQACLIGDATCSVPDQSPTLTRRHKLWHVAVKTARRLVAELLTPRSDTSPRGDACLPTPRRVYNISLKFLVVIPRTPESCAKHIQSCTVFKASVIGSRPAPTVGATSPLQHGVPTCWRKVCLRSWVIWKYTATGLIGVPDCMSPTECFVPVHEQVATSRRLIFCSRRFNVSSWLASSLPLGADSLPTTFQLHTTTHHARQLIGYRFQTAHVSMPTFPIQKTRHDFFRPREKIVAGFSNLQRAPDHTRLQKTAQDTPRACQNYTWKNKTAHDFRIMANRDQSWAVWKWFSSK